MGAQRDAAELKEHPFFSNIDWVALSLKQVTPPFKPVVESDESTNNFDPEFTSADIRDVGVAGLLGIMSGDEDEDAGEEGDGEEDGEEEDGEWLDEDDPSEDWVSQSVGALREAMHTPNGPLGSERTPPLNTNGTHRTNSKKKTANGTRKATATTATANRGSSRKVNGVLNGLNLNGSTSTGSGSGPGSSTATTTKGIQIQKKKTQNDPNMMMMVNGTPLTNSVQENFKGFTYHGGESVVAPMRLALSEREKERRQREGEEAVMLDDEDDSEMWANRDTGRTTEDEMEDVTTSAGRYATSRYNRNDGSFGDDDDMS